MIKLHEENISDLKNTIGDLMGKINKMSKELEKLNLEKD